MSDILTGYKPTVSGISPLSAQLVLDLSKKKLPITLVYDGVNYEVNVVENELKLVRQ